MIFDATMLNIGREKQLLVDDLLIESAENVCRIWHEPARVAENPLLFKDQPWEHVTDFEVNTWQVLRDPKDRLFKCIYGDYYKPELRPEDTVMGTSALHMLYAESEDGIHWRKPLFDIRKFEGKPTNIVIPFGYDPGLILDPHEKDETKRFKIIYNELIPGRDADVATVVAATSGDGIHWERLPDHPIMGSQGSRLDDVIIMRYDPYGRIFIMTTRHYDMYAVARNLDNPVLSQFCPPYYPLDWRRMNKRRIWQAESADFIHWTDPYPVLPIEDDADDLDETFYGLCPYRAGNITMGFLNVMYYVPNTLRVRLVYTRNGKIWHHLNKRQPFLNPAGDGTWDAYYAGISSPPVEVGDELYIYYGGACNHHDWWITGAREGLNVPEATDINKVAYALGLAKLRLDGFCSLAAGPARRGILITRPVISDGKQLVVNAKCQGAGSLAAEIVNLKDEVFPGYSREECDVFTGDSVRHVFSWRGKTELPPAATGRAEYPKPEFERFRKIRFYMDRVELYALTLA